MVRKIRSLRVDRDADAAIQEDEDLLVELILSP
jgi:hypothetical protein